MEPCVRRKSVEMFEADGSKTMAFRCAERTAPMHTLTVIESDCEACPVREIVNKMSIDRQARRTSNLRGFIRQDKDTGSPGFPDCDSRQVATVQACCGETCQVWVCDHRASSRYGSEVSPEICNRCPLKSQ